MPNVPCLSVSLVLAERWPIAGSLILNEWSPGACFLSHALLMSLSTESVSSPPTRLKSPREMPTISHCEATAQPMFTRSLPKEHDCDLPEAFRAVDLLEKLLCVEAGSHEEHHLVGTSEKGSVWGAEVGGRILSTPCCP